MNSRIVLGAVAVSAALGLKPPRACR